MIEQMDLFTDFQKAPAYPIITPQPVHDGLRRNDKGATLNGFYYEQSTGLFVSFVLGRRYYETDGHGSNPEWRNGLKKERAIE